MKNYEVGDMARMAFHMGGLITYENMEVIDVDGDNILLDKGSGIEDAWMFNVKTGNCLNDNNFLGAFRKLVV